MVLVLALQGKSIKSLKRGKNYKYYAIRNINKYYTMCIYNQNRIDLLIYIKIICLKMWNGERIIYKFLKDHNNCKDTAYKFAYIFNFNKSSQLYFVDIKPCASKFFEKVLINIIIF